MNEVIATDASKHRRVSCVGVHARCRKRHLTIVPRRRFFDAHRCTDRQISPVLFGSLNILGHRWHVIVASLVLGLVVLAYSVPGVSLSESARMTFFGRL